MYTTIRTFPQQFITGYRLGVSPPPAFAPPSQKASDGHSKATAGKHPSPLSILLRQGFGGQEGRGKVKGNIFLTGMGGSALPGDLLNDYLGGCETISIVRDYQLPSRSPSPGPSTGSGPPSPSRGEGWGEGDLVICSSYSGNTEETLSAFDDALAKKANIIVLTHGGKLKEKAIKHKIPLVSIPDCIQPRCAAGYFFASMLSVLEKVGRVSPQKKVLAQLTGFLEKRRDQHEKSGKKLAKQLIDKVPIIYGPTEFTGTCRVWKIKFNENSKIQSFYNVFPELNHNEMVGYTKLLMPATFIFLRSKFMHKRIGRRMDVMGSILADRISVHNINLEGENLLQEMFDSLAIADYASYYLAREYGVDPAAVKMVEDFKKLLV